MPKKTILFDQHQALGGRMVEFHGWLLPVQYEGIIAEHDQCRRCACVFDTCHMGQFHISAPAGELSRALTQDAEALAIGACRYGFLLDERGGIIDDTVLMRLGAEEFLLIVNASPRADDLACLKERVSDAARILDRSSEWGKLDVQGPASFEALGNMVDVDISALGYFRAMRAFYRGYECVVARSGYTGELGYEVFLPAEAAVELFTALADHPLVTPAGLGARDMLRLEMCYPLYGEDISRKTTPIEADLGRFVDLRRDYVGADALAKLVDDGPARKLVAFRCQSRRRGDAGVDILHDGKLVGTVTSAGYSPSLGVSIGMGYVETPLASAGTQISLRCQRGNLDAVVASKPLYTQGTCRTRNIAWESEL